MQEQDLKTTVAKKRAVPKIAIINIMIQVKLCKDFVDNTVVLFFKYPNMKKLNR